MSNGELVDIIHIACGEPAFRMTRRPLHHDMALSSEVVHLDGTPGRPREVVKCGSCGAYIGPVMDLEPDGGWG